jgi:hypothetical protein
MNASGGAAGNAGASNAGSAGLGNAGQNNGDPPDGSVDVEDSGLDAGPPECCPVSPEPACTMYYGGTKSSPDDSCGPESDGMPYPSPAWELSVNEDGCPYWLEPAPRAPWDCCGCAVAPDAGLDSGLCDAGTPDIADLNDAVTICEDYDSCHICVQTEDSEGNPIRYYVYPSDQCPCLDPEVIAVSDAG